MPLLPGHSGNISDLSSRVGSEPPGGLVRMLPQHTTASVQGGPDPTWNDACELTDSQPEIDALEASHDAMGQLAGSQRTVPLTGNSVLMMVTVHAVGSGPGDAFCGRVVSLKAHEGKDGQRCGPCLDSFCADGSGLSLPESFER